MYRDTVSGYHDMSQYASAIPLKSDLVQYPEQCTKIQTRTKTQPLIWTHT